MIFFNIDTDSDNYSDSDDYDSSGDDTDDDLKAMTESEMIDMKYLAIFENEYSDFDEKIMSSENSEELKKMEGAIIDRTN